ncbi:helix-turn-helix domain-containing protein [Streptococcus thermophilus]|uniref:helix-turn-helix domain-containing protein n=1 Tax=Streptococcus thermophilus TaxID=1308 RepID=UPI001C64A5BC|nr:helix-turn-helix domain-containing protein [Streptococcus thermophilus]MBW7798079.1 helix-turn-helix domain-containing protein [Streptococcus thermophilus]
MTYIIQNFGPNLTRLRKERGISQVELSNQLQIGKQSISDYEKQKAFPTFANLDKIAEYFNASPTDLFGTPQQIQLEKAVFETDEYSNKASTILKASKAISELEYDKNFQNLINDLLFLTRGYQLYDSRGEELYRDNDGRLTTEVEEAIELARGNAPLDLILGSEGKINELFEKVRYISDHSNIEDK